MPQQDWLLGDSPNPLGNRVEEIRKKLIRKNPSLLAEQTNTKYTPENDDSGFFHLPFWGKEIKLHFPAFTGTYTESGQEINTFDLTMLAYYFETCKGIPAAGEWIAFNQIPGGMFYAQAFQGYSGEKLQQFFDDDLDVFIEANEKIGGQRVNLGDAAFSYQILPRVPILVACWLGDEDFPSSYRILFDANAHHQLVTDAYAILGSNLTRKLLKSAEA